MAINRAKFLGTLKDYVFITLGIALYAFGFCGFILPEKVVIGGLAGAATIVYLLTGIPVAVTQFGCNLLLLAVAYKVVGRHFVLGTIYGATMISVFIGVFQPLFADGFTNEPFMNLVIGGVLCGMGIGTCLAHNGSSGGTDIVAAMVAKKSNISIGRTMVYTDACIISSSYFLFHNLQNTVCGFIAIFLISYMADYVVNSSRQSVQFTVFSRKWEDIATAINNTAKRGCTVLNGVGFYSKHEVKILLVICRKFESGLISRIIKSIDPDAFVTQANVSGVYGKGFDELKVKIKRPEQENELKEDEIKSNIRKDVDADRRHPSLSTSGSGVPKSMM